MCLFVRGSMSLYWISLVVVLLVSDLGVETLDQFLLVALLAASEVELEVGLVG